MKIILSVILLFVLSFSMIDPVEWPEYLGGPDRNHYSSLKQINIANVSQLEKAWEYHTYDTSAQMQCNPIIVHGRLYGLTASLEVFCLDAATGKEIWKFTESKDVKWYTLGRGVTYWEEGEDQRIFFSQGNLLYALNASTGALIKTFGNNGKVSLSSGLGSSAKDKFVISSTPGTIFEDKIIMPLRLSESSDAAPGFIQAFNVRTGKLDWVFKTIPAPGEYGYETWAKNNYKNVDVGGANNWSGMSIDRKRGIVFVPTGSAAFDFYGGNRKGNNLFANCLLALDARTGKRKWHYQLVHHDLWDRDLPAPPNLVTIDRNGKKIDAVAQITKQGYVYVFERETGKPIYKINEVPVSTKNALPGEFLSKTQPIPILPAPFSRTTMTEKDISPYAENKNELIERLRKISKAPYDPPSKNGSLILPGFDGGGEWGGASYDPVTGILYVNASEMPWILEMIDAPSKETTINQTPGAALYANNCAVCHQKNRQGNPASGYPSLVDINKRSERSVVANVITNGKGMMPGFTALTKIEKQQLIDFLFDTEKKEIQSAPSKSTKPTVPYGMNGYNKFLDNKGYPAIAPPWGTLSAIDLNTGKYVWRIPFGEDKKLTAKGIPVTGLENYGGGVVTAGGLFIIGATKDETFRIFDKSTGKLLWQTELPASAFATPSTYEVNGKQYIVVTCGGTKLGTKRGDSYVAFALKDN
jgi:quinoprotein glucose dehydrogenase